MAGPVSAAPSSLSRCIVASIEADARIEQRRAGCRRSACRPASATLEQQDEACRRDTCPATTSARSSSGPAVGRLSTMAVMVTPEISRGSTQPMVETNGLSAIRTGYFSMILVLGQALGPGGDDVGLVQLVGEVGAQDPDQRRGAGGADDDDRDPQVRPTGRRTWPSSTAHLTYSRREQPADGLPEVAVGDVHQRQRQDEVGDGEADEAEEGEDVVADRMPPHRRVDADRQRHGPDEQQRSATETDSVEPMPLPDQPRRPAGSTRTSSRNRRAGRCR